MTGPELLTWLLVIFAGAGAGPPVVYLLAKLMAMGWHRGKRAASDYEKKQRHSGGRNPGGLKYLSNPTQEENN